MSVLVYCSCCMRIRRVLSTAVRSQFCLEGIQSYTGCLDSDHPQAVIFLFDGHHVGLLLVAAAVLCFTANWLKQQFPGREFTSSLTAIGFLGLAIGSFAVMYKFLPDVKISWWDVWGGAAVAATLVTFGGWLLLFLIRNFNLNSALEAAVPSLSCCPGFIILPRSFCLARTVHGFTPTALVLCTSQKPRQDFQ